MTLQSVFDYRSPYAYLANTRLPELNTPISYSYDPVSYSE